MSLQQLGFWLLAIVSVATALGVIAVRNPVRCALYLVVNFGALAVLYLLLNAQLLATLQVLVYAGAIMVLFLFVIMLLNLGGEQIEHDPLMGQRPLAAVFGGVLLIGLAGAFQRWAEGVSTPVAPATAQAAGEDQVRIIGQKLMVDYVYPFEVTSLLLLIGIIGTILLAKRRLGGTTDPRPARRSSDPSASSGQALVGALSGAASGSEGGPVKPPGS